MKFELTQRAIKAIASLLELVEGEKLTDEKLALLQTPEGFLLLTDKIVNHDWRTQPAVVAYVAAEIGEESLEKADLLGWADAVATVKAPDQLDMARLLAAPLVVVFIGPLNGLNILGAYTFLSKIIDAGVKHVHLVVSARDNSSLVVSANQLNSAVIGLGLEKHIRRTPVVTPKTARDVHNELLPQLIQGRLSHHTFVEMEGNSMESMKLFAGLSDQVEYVSLGVDNALSRSQLASIAADSKLMHVDVELQMPAAIQAEFYGEKFGGSTRRKQLDYLLAGLSKLERHANRAKDEQTE